MRAKAKITYGGGATDWFRFGGGERILAIIPGMSIKPISHSAEAIADAFAAFAEDYTVYVFGRGRKVREDCTIETLAEDVAEAMDGLGLRGANVFAVSLGGMIALRLALARPDLVGSLALCSTCAGMDGHGRAETAKWAELADSGDGTALCREMIKYIYSPEFVSANREAFGFLETMGEPDDISRIARLARAGAGFDAAPELGKITCPAFVLGSERDALIAPEAMRALAEGLGCGIYMYEGYGHAVYDEAPDFRGRLKAFFDSIR
jgi:pimeloyl-ACP methyl ester carboxylesterase